MITDKLGKIEDTLKAKPRPAARTGQVASSLRYDWIMAVLTAWLIVGIHVDGWAHQHVPGLETFFTPWHALFYSAVITISSFLAITLVGNHLRGYAWTKSLPAGYGLSFIGVIVFSLGGVGDMFWHTLLGVEVSVEALLSPSHLSLAAGGILITTGPLRSAWVRVRNKNLTFFKLLPMLISVAMLLSIFTFFTQYGSPFATTWAARNREVFTRQLMEFNVTIGLVGLLLQSAVLMGLTLLLVRRWSLPFGSLTFLYVVNIGMLTFMRDRQLATGVGALVLAALVTGLAADLLIWRFKPSGENRLAFRVFAFGVPALLYALYFVAIQVSGGIWWTPAVWSGAVLLAGAIGLFISYVALPPRIPAEVSDTPDAN